MALFGIGDLHLSLGADKPMDIFVGWEGYLQKLEQNWRQLVKQEDTVVVNGDISWAMSLANTEADFTFLQKLPGIKILSKGNHDYWWTSKSKMETYFAEKGFSSLRILHNNCIVAQGAAICGTRGWMFESGQPHDEKMVNREAIRLEASLSEGTKTGLEPVAFLHYPPIFGQDYLEPILAVLEKYRVERCYYGHIHGGGIRYAFQGNYRGTVFRLVSSDALGFRPYRIL